MYQEKRPTCVTVIGWAWIIIGILMLLSSIMGLLGSVWIGQTSAAQPDAQQDTRGFFEFFPLLAVVQLAMAAFGIVSGINFLKLKRWSRSALEVLTWLLLLFLAGFVVFWVFNWFSMTSGQGPMGFSMIGAVMTVVVSGVYGVPLGIMLKFLRGDKVKMAMRAGIEPPA